MNNKIQKHSIASHHTRTQLIIIELNSDACPQSAPEVGKPANSQTVRVQCLSKVYSGTFSVYTY